MWLKPCDLGSRSRSCNSRSKYAKFGYSVIPLFSAKKTGRVVILGSMVGSGLQKSTVDLGVNWCIFKVTGHLYVTCYSCLSVCLHLFPGMVKPRDLIFCTIVGYRSETKPIDFGVNEYIFKVKVMKI